MTEVNKVKKKRCVFDVEANGFLRFVNKFHCAGIIDVDTEEEFWFRPDQLLEFLMKLDEFDICAAHNGSGYDEYALMKLAKIYGIEWVVDIDKFVDTLIMSQVLKYHRFNNRDRNYKQYLRDRESGAIRKDKKVVMGDSHSLARWGIFFGDYKGDHTDFEEFSEEMFEYMKQDVRLNLKVYRYLFDELMQWIQDLGNNKIVRAIQIETDNNRIVAEQHMNGWLIDKEKLPTVIDQIQERMDEIAAEVDPTLGYILRKVSGDKKSKYGEYVKDEYVTKSGKYASWLNKWFDFDPDTGVKDGIVKGPFCRVSFEKANIGNVEAVKKRLYSIGWVPDEYNGKWADVEEDDDADEDGLFDSGDDGQVSREKQDLSNVLEINRKKRMHAKGPKYWKVTSPKITESSLEHLEGAGDINEFYTLRSRKSIIEGWTDYIDDEGRLHGDAFNIGTPTFRQTHSIIVNLPSGKAVLGPEVRGLFVAEPGWKVVSADSAACQLRLLSHYMDDPEFLRELLDGDMHQKNADILTSSARRLLKDTTIIVSRPDAKPFIFAFLYGAGGPKLTSILKLPSKIGKQLKEQFQEAYPKLNKLIKKIQGIVKRQGFIIGLDGRPIYCESQHKSLNYLVQGAEAVVMKATISMLWRRMKEEKLDFRMLLFYHDEVNIEVKDHHVDRAKEIIEECFAEAPKEFGIDIMVCGDCIAGDDYYEVH